MSQFEDYMSAQTGELDDKRLENVLTGIEQSISSLTPSEEQPTEQPQGDASAPSTQQAEPAAEAAPKQKEDSQQLDQSMPWQEGYDAGDLARTWQSWTGCHCC